ncbi:aldehyde dehydrogenase family protein [Streptomyces antimycoticus]|uniref:aldehyde dehydrogenase family protein n=1 Tax=Streptomyces antimycoticus TaxID=68175 RepID=UPI000A3D629E|nr:aldehyde dehydrogenase family protein [Streptomyces antimycoticus]
MRGTRTVVPALINGNDVTATDTGLLARHDPSDGSRLPDVVISGSDEVETAVAVCHETFASGAWSALPPADRGAVLLRLADLVERDGALLAELDSKEAGKPIRECLAGDVSAALEALRWFGGAADKLHGSTSVTAPSEVGMTLREPLGVVAAIMPWNYPMAQASWKIGPALAAGNSLVLKPSEWTPSSALHMARLAIEAGVPAGAIAVLPGSGDVTGAAIAAHPGISALSFTGSVDTGRAVLRAAADSNFKRVSLEMGGKSPQILMPDALTYGQALIDHMIDSAFMTMGENCTAGSRILVHESIAGEVTERFLGRARALVVGNAMDEATDLGPLITEDAAARVRTLVRQAVADGAELLLGDPLDHPSGPRFVGPVVLRVSDQGSEIQQTEVFGPVVTISTFSSEDEAVAMANDSLFGLAASLWTRDIDRAMRMARAVQAGVVSINSYSEGGMSMPFGGYKQSGFGGKERGMAAFEQWTQSKTVWLQLHSDQPGGVRAAE